MKIMKAVTSSSQSSVVLTSQGAVEPQFPTSCEKSTDTGNCCQARSSFGVGLRGARAFFLSPFLLRINPSEYVSQKPVFFKSAIFSISRNLTSLFCSFTKIGLHRSGGTDLEWKAVAQAVSIKDSVLLAFAAVEKPSHRHLR